MQTVAEYLARYGVTVTPEAEAKLIKIANDFHAAGLYGFWEALPRLIELILPPAFTVTAAPVGLRDSEDLDGAATGEPDR